MNREITVQRMVKQNVVVGETVICDVCKKTIMTTNENNVTFCIGKYWSLMTGHHDWGTDSIDSIEHKDLCSKECLQKELDEYVKLRGTAYFEVSCEDKRKVEQ